jgi:hypothetical protein
MPVTLGHPMGRLASGRPVRPLIGLTFLIPGAPQWCWRQPERALCLFGSFTTALAVGLFAWGTRTGLALLGFAFLAHVVSTSDAIRQWSFPGFGRWVPLLSASAGLAVVFYGPLLLAGSVLAWPGIGSGENPEGYLVDLSAYQVEGPESGDRVWLAPDRNGRDGRIAEVVAKSGQNVEWTGRWFRVNGKQVAVNPVPQTEAPTEMEFQVPEGQLLVAGRNRDPYTSRSWEFVPTGRVEGRAWAKLYPVWDRRLLH